MTGTMKPKVCDSFFWSFFLFISQ